MAFCTGCGSQMDDHAAFCTKCGTKTAAAPQSVTSGGAAVAPATQSAVTKSDNTVVKVILAIVGVLVLLGILAVAGTFYAAYRIKKAVVVDEKSGSISTPWGKVASTNDSASVAKQLNVELYPGAKTTESSGVVTFGNITTGSITLQTSDSAQDVINFYKAKFPKAQIMTSGDTHATLMVGDKTNLLTISADTAEGVTTITISRTTGIGMPGQGSNDNG